ncbi:MAG: hypothetical protein JWN70_254 [Planctomycetaceae bacterium]|nr:hypothetical protein [Planctomycetaceae bacterium]
MRIETGIVESDLTVRGDWTITGIVQGNLTVTAGSNLQLTGICEGNLVVEAGGTADITGIVEGRIINNGGKITRMGPPNVSETRTYTTIRGNGTVVTTREEVTYSQQTNANGRTQTNRRPPQSYVPSKGITGADVANAAEREKHCKSAWEKSGAHLVAKEQIDQAKSDIDRLSAEQHSLNRWFDLGEVLQIADLRFHRWFRKSATATAFMRVVFVILVPAFVAVFYSTNCLAILGWNLLPIFLGLCIMAYLLFYPFTEKVEARLAELHLEREAKVRYAANLRQNLSEARDLFARLTELRSCQMAHKYALDEYDRLAKEFKSRRNDLLNVEWSTLRGCDFELFLKDVFEELGFNVRTTKISGDQGVDLVASKGQVRIAIQAKGWANNVSNSAVQAVVAGKLHYDCTSCVVITNSSYTRSARELARSTNCRLIDRTEIRNLVHGKIYS